MARVDRSPRSAATTAAEPTRLLRLHRRDFDEILRKESPLAVKLVRSFVQVRTERLRNTTADFSSGRAPGQRQAASRPSVLGAERSRRKLRFVRLAAQHQRPRESVIRHTPTGGRSAPASHTPTGCLHLTDRAQPGGDHASNADVRGRIEW